MTVRRDPDLLPDPYDDQSSRDAGRQGKKADPDRNPRQADDERRGVVYLAGRVLSSPGATVRALIFFGVMLAMVLLAAGVFGLSVDIGPLHINPGGTISHRS